jgi:hypothetical protein
LYLYRDCDAEDIEPKQQSKLKACIFVYRDSDAEDIIEPKQQSKPKAGPFGPLGTTNAAFLKYFDRRRSITVPFLPQSVIVDSDSSQSYQRSRDPDPDEQITNL